MRLKNGETHGNGTVSFQINSKNLLNISEFFFLKAMCNDEMREFCTQMCMIKI